MTFPQPAFPLADHRYTLARALDRLGHRCLACPGTMGLARAPVLIIRHSGSAAANTLVVVDLTDDPMPSDRSRQLLQAVNDCLRSDRILVCERRAIVMVGAPAAFTDFAADAPPALAYHHFDATTLRRDRT